MFSASCTSVILSPITNERVKSTLPFCRYSFTKPSFGFRHVQLSASKCGQIRTSSNTTPWLSKMAIMALCGLSKSSCGKLSVPKPSWLLTITSLNPAAFSLSSTGITFGSKTSFSKLSNCLSTGGSSTSVPSRSINKMAC